MKNEDRRANKKVLRLCRNIDKQADDLEKLHPASIPTIGGSEPVGLRGGPREPATLEVLPVVPPENPPSRLRMS
jgi:hypothetical protein